MSKSFEKDVLEIINKKWKNLETKYFYLKYDLILTREYVSELSRVFDNCCRQISETLECPISHKMTIYLSKENNNDFINSNIPWNSSIPHLNIAFIKTGKTDREMRIIITHEIVHLLSYKWDEKLFHIEFLEEGLACYLSNKRRNLHKIFLINMIYNIKQYRKYDNTLYISTKPNTVDYHKAASFTKYLIENYGIRKYKKLYIACNIDKKNQTFRLNG